MTDPKGPQAGDPEPEEIVERDDTVIAVAFRRSSIAIVAALAVGLAAWALLRHREPAERIRAKTVEPPATFRAATDSMPTVRFTDVTREAGIRFVHANGATGEKLLPETMGGGVAFLDYDGDGDPDLLLTNGTDWPGHDRGRRPTPALYENDGHGKFEDVTRRAGLDVTMYGMGVAAGDYDGDGDPDLFLTAVGRNRLMRNDGGRFRDVTAEAGVGGDPDAWSTSAGFFDYDLDGDLDLFVCNYVRWSRKIDLEVGFTMNGTDRAYGPPTNFAGAFPYLYRNDGDGRFTEVGESAGIRVVNPATGQPAAKALAIAIVDVGDDGLPDVLVSNDTVANFLFRNLGDGRFEEVGSLAGVGYDMAGHATGAMGIDAAHYRDDDALAFAIGNFANEMSSLYVADGDPWQFADEASLEGLGSPSRKVLSFGLFFFDFDLDGRLDLLETNGHLEEAIHEVQPSQTYRQPAQLFWNAGPSAEARFAEVPADRCGDLAAPIAGRGAAFADVDGDGDLDVALAQVAGPAVLLRNDQDLGHHWLGIRLLGAPPNTGAIGASIEVDVGGVTRRRSVMPTRSYLSQVELPVVFGLGTATSVDAVRVRWPDGAVQQVEVPGVDRRIEVRRR